MSIPLRGIRTGTPVPRRDKERRIPSPVTTYKLSDEELAHYRNLGRTGKRASITKEETDVATIIPISKDEYLAKRLSGMNRAQIADELELKHQSYLYPQLEKWGIRAKADEEAAIAEYAQTLASAPISTGSSDSAGAPDSSDTTLATDATSSTDSGVSSDAIENEAGRDESASDGDPTVSSQPLSAANSDTVADSRASTDTIESVSSTLSRLAEQASVQYVTVRIPIRAGGWSSVVKSSTRNDCITIGMDYLQEALHQARLEMSDLLGTDDLATHLQAYIDRKVKELVSC